MDDVIVYSQTIDELIDNLTQVFERFCKSNITSNPEICRFGMTETEYVGMALTLRVGNSQMIKISQRIKIPQRLGE